jgi:hypothetical protein
MTTEEVDAHSTEIFVSASQRRAVAWLNDGQGANGYEVCALTGRHVGSVSAKS